MWGVFTQSLRQHYNSGFSVGAADMYLRMDGEQNQTVIWKTFYDQGSLWNLVSVQLGRITKPFQIALGKISLGVFDGVSALDDVTFRNCSMPPAVKECPAHTHFHCAESKACVEQMQRCDLTDDCGDASDEQGCSPELQCSFEHGLCSWKQEQSGGDVFDWTLIQGPTPTLITGPWKDHTLGTSAGHYLYIESSGPQEFKDSAVLLSRTFRPTVQWGGRKHCVFRFHYHMFGSHVFCLGVFMRTASSGRGHMLWVRYGDQGNLWHRKTLYLTSARPFQIVIEGTVGDDFNGDIAIDDLSFLDCEPHDVTTPPPTVRPHVCPDGQFACGSFRECVPDSKVCDFSLDCSDGSDELYCVRERCDFEGGDTCGWQSNDSSLVSTHAFRCGGPEGWYMCADSSNGRYGQTSDLQTPVMTSNGPQCTLVFWYHMSGFTVGSLQVLLKYRNSTHEVWSQSGSQGNKWRRGEMFIGIANNFQVVFRAKRGISYMGDVVIDDVTFLHCVPPPSSGDPCTPEQFTCRNQNCISQDQLCDFIDHCGDQSDEEPYICQGFSSRCSFEFDLCSWRQSGMDDFDWLIKAGGTFTGGTGPISDHTLRDPSGHYLYLESSFPQAAGHSARISGPLLSRRSKHCQVRFFSHMSGEGIGTLSVFRGGEARGFDLLLNLTGDQGHAWQRMEVQLSRQEEDFQVVFEGKVGKNPKGDICLDDISFSSGCLLASEEEDAPLPPAGSGPPGFFPCENGGCFSTAQSCDFTDDCGDGSDEMHCGTSCTFEHGLCGWKSSVADNFDWTLGTGSVKSIRPPYDHTLSDERGNKWNRAEVPLRNLRNFQVIFEGIRSMDVSGGASLDDLEFRNCSPNAVQPPSCPALSDFVCESGHCIESHLECDSKDDCADGSDEKHCGEEEQLEIGICDFSMGAAWWERSCGFDQDSEDDFDWSIGRHSETPGAGPQSDHSPGGDGSFLYIHSAYQREGDVAKVTTSRPFPASVGLCRVRFWFFMHGSDRMGTLKVFTSGPSGSSLLMWAAAGNHGNEWSYANVILSNPAEFTVSFQAEVGGDVWTDIALDDLSFTAECTAGGPVTPQPATCSGDQYQCLFSPQCIPESWRCDGELDCGDQSDEDECPAVVPGTLPPQDQCEDGQFQCLNAVCLPSVLRCDGVSDCPHGEDENSCPVLQCMLGELQCETGSGCIPFQKRCDGSADCQPFLSDESSCHECPPLFCLDHGSCYVFGNGPVCMCFRGWTGNRCHVKEKPVLSTVTPEPEDTQLVSVYVGIGIGLLLLVAGFSVCTLVYLKKRCCPTKPKNYGVMDNQSCDWRAELSCHDRPGCCPGVNIPSRRDIRGLSISVYPWRKEVEQGSSKLSFANPLYNHPPEGKSSKA
ncbi:hypothetical protein JOQ06_027963 [Pogonophryne albipinna]|uniref:MAM and LDL-receptor class A domain-containing protein 1 n=1 Tax=Pogonophryne albipinna TaxID=1090488 RepID=A0AAD6F435_9TELE|nr:hypothetical protein JOQ06_027963 [Pogonophryne albipinna]